MVFTTERFFEVAIESWPERDLNPRPLNFGFWFAFSRLWIEYLCISLYSVRMLENTNQKNSESGHFSRR